MKKLKTLVKSPAFLAIMAICVFVPMHMAGALVVDPIEGISQDTNIMNTVMTIINFVLLIVGTIAVLFLIIGGFRYVISAGNTDQKEKAQKTITYSIIGIVIVLLAFVIVMTINNILLNQL